MSFARSQPPCPQPRAIARWLLAVAAMVFLMLVVGGITRLTESGLSMVRWEPISGIVPPLGEPQWQAEFDAYRATPEYRKVNTGMELAQFKRIFFWEYLHRAIGRLIGLAFALPLLWFWWRRAIPRGYGPRLGALLALGALQGAIGWWMVASGLVDRPDVSHLRLATHLIAALLIMAGLIWTALDLLALHQRAAPPARFGAYALLVSAVVLVQILYGAFVAGLDAGYVSNTWPLMNDRFFPAGVDAGGSPLAAMSSDPYLVHFIHRWWAWVVVVVLVFLARRVKRAGARPVSIAIHAAFGTQILLGVATVMSGMNIVLAAAHQAVGAILVGTVCWGLHALGSPTPANASR
jgi:cytochrome c oxidase assembly protein subunit 15